MNRDHRQGGVGLKMGDNRALKMHCWRLDGERDGSPAAIGAVEPGGFGCLPGRAVHLLLGWNFRGSRAAHLGAFPFGDRGHPHGRKGKLCMGNNWISPAQ